MSDIIFYSNPQSRGQIIHWMLEELGEPYHTEWVAYGEPMKSPAYLAVNPMGKVPAIRHRRSTGSAGSAGGGNDKGREVIVTEVAAICAYLAMAYPAKGLMPPPDHPAMADYFRWLFFAAGPLEMAVTTRNMKWESKPEHSPMLGFGSYQNTLDTIEGHLADREFICDSGFSAADVCLGSHLGWGMQFKTIEPRDVFKRYTEGLNSREAYQRADRICREQAASSQ